MIQVLIIAVGFGPDLCLQDQAVSAFDRSLFLTVDPTILAVESLRALYMSFYNVLSAMERQQGSSEARQVPRVGRMNLGTSTSHGTRAINQELNRQLQYIVSTSGHQTHVSGLVRHSISNEYKDEKSSAHAHKDTITMGDRRNDCLLDCFLFRAIQICDHRSIKVDMPQAIEES